MIPTSGTRSPQLRSAELFTVLPPLGIRLTCRVHRSRIRIDGVHAVMLGHDVQNVVRAAGNRHRRQIQGLRVHRAIDRARKITCQIECC